MSRIPKACWLLPRLMILFAIACAGLAAFDLFAQERLPPKPAQTAKEQAQPAAESEEPEKAAEAKSIGQVLLEKTNWLGWTFYAVEGSVSVIAMTIVLERLFSVRRGRLMPRRFVRRLRDLVARREDTLDNLRNLCESSDAPIANVLRSGLLRAGRPLPEVEKSLEDAMAREASDQRGRNRMLSVIAAIAPMIGLLGTVVGMILAFRVTSQAGTGKAELLAEGIYLALLRTAFGLVIAVPALWFAHWFNNKVDRYMREMVDVLEEVIPTFASLERAAEPGGEMLRAAGPTGRVRPG